MRIQRAFPVGVPVSAINVGVALGSQFIQAHFVEEYNLTIEGETIPRFSLQTFTPLRRLVLSPMRYRR